MAWTYKTGLFKQQMRVSTVNPFIKLERDNELEEKAAATSEVGVRLRSFSFTTAWAPAGWRQLRCICVSPAMEVRVDRSPTGVSKSSITKLRWKFLQAILEVEHRL
ncbi:hypothetical protein PPTG_24516 [Phytophthora nicotianae INRA-310]|uniref:Uncharacterized protein n=1 Tax=Phytophthora nicotianae (strain INRA-310) TaxID=761204 RepID=W2PG82_PHYN3|nr:hypothetical protein PPTG_24516 [Phytophthora nicotianae INRA-310]ETM99019.1 hypothetical protein PPTG_24516 [Phytophthora nicotianae INRA-310]